MSENWSKDMSRGKAQKELEAIEDKLCCNALDKAKAEEMFGWVEITDEQILLNQKICSLYLKFAKN